MLLGWKLKLIQIHWDDGRTIVVLSQIDIMHIYNTDRYAVGLNGNRFFSIPYATEARAKEIRDEIIASYYNQQIYIMPKE